MFGILNINKPLNVTSRDIVTRVVQVIRNTTGTKPKAGHAGTLDPLASGVLIVCLGKATRLVPYIQRSLKTYNGTFQLDVTSDSADTESSVAAIDQPVVPPQSSIEELIPRFTGRIQQKPPAYSAISIDGQRAYRLARKGIDFDVPSKEVFISKLEILSYEYPDLEMMIECGSGTYIRSLGRDMARAINSDAVMTRLVRTSIGQFELETAIDADELDYDLICSALGSPIHALSDLPHVQINQQQVDDLANGRFVGQVDVKLPDGRQIGTEFPEELVAVDEQQQLVAIIEPIENKLKSKINFV